MPGLKKILLRTAMFGAVAAAVPAIVFARSPAQPESGARQPAPKIEVIAVPVPAFTPMPGFAQLVPAAMIRQIDAMQAQMAALQRLAFQPMALPAMPHGPGPVMRVSMMSASGPGGYCSRSMTITPGPNGKARVVTHQSGNACGAAPASVPQGAHQGAHGVDLNGQHFLPPNRVPPPSKLIYARYNVPPRQAAAG